MTPTLHQFQVTVADPFARVAEQAAVLCFFAIGPGSSARGAQRGSPKGTRPVAKLTRDNIVHDVGFSHGVALRRDARQRMWVSPRQHMCTGGPQCLHAWRHWRSVRGKISESAHGNGLSAWSYPKGSLIIGGWKLWCDTGTRLGTSQPETRRSGKSRPAYG